VQQAAGTNSTPAQWEAAQASMTTRNIQAGVLASFKMALTQNTHVQPGCQAVLQPQHCRLRSLTTRYDSLRAPTCKTRRSLSLRRRWQMSRRSPACARTRHVNFDQCAAVWQKHAMYIAETLHIAAWRHGSFPSICSSLGMPHAPHCIIADNRWQ